MTDTPSREPLTIVYDSLAGVDDAESSLRLPVPRTRRAATDRAQTTDVETEAER